MSMSATMMEIGPIFALILVGFLPNEVWRVLGLMLVTGLDEESEVLVWVRAVATAMHSAMTISTRVRAPSTSSMAP